MKSMSKLIIANWKSEKSVEQTQQWLDKFSESLQHPMPEGIVILPPMPSVAIAIAELHEFSLLGDITVGVQDISPFPAGSYTGAVSPQNLANLGVQYALVGHSERRRHFHETHQDVAKKVEQSLANGITPIVCVDKEYLDAQASAIEKKLLQECIVAYEPLSAIGSGQNEDVGTVKETIREIKRAFGDVKVLYGGSVNHSNVQEYLLVADGVLVGSASLDVYEFLALIEKSQQ